VTEHDCPGARRGGLLRAAGAGEATDVDIVERALAILEEESRSWVPRQRGIAPQSEAFAGPGRQRGDGIP
jgi:hypothetical protein